MLERIGAVEERSILWNCSQWTRLRSPTFQSRIIVGHQSTQQQGPGPSRTLQPRQKAGGLCVRGVRQRAMGCCPFGVARLRLAGLRSLGGDFERWGHGSAASAWLGHRQESQAWPCRWSLLAELSFVRHHVRRMLVGWDGARLAMRLSFPPHSHWLGGYRCSSGNCCFALEAFRPHPGRDLRGRPSWCVFDEARALRSFAHTPHERMLWTANLSRSDSAE